MTLSHRSLSDWSRELATRLKSASILRVTYTPNSTGAMKLSGVLGSAQSLMAEAAIAVADAGTEISRLTARVDELLVANNREVERRRAAEAALSGSLRDCTCYRPEGHDGPCNGATRATRIEGEA